MPGEPLSKELRAIAIATAVIWAVMLVTGIVQWFLYRPRAAAAYADMEALRSQVRFGQVVRYVHRSVGWFALLAPFSGLVVALAQRRTGPSIAWAQFVVLALAMSLTGYLIPWDQLALWAVTAGTNLRGFTPVFGDNARFVLVNGVEVSASTFGAWVLVHVVVLPLVTAVISAVVMYRSRRSGRQPLEMTQ